MSNEITVVGAQTRISGDLTGESDLKILGRIDGTISLTQSLIVEPSGIVVAEVQANSAVISGVVVGNITATESIHITSKGNVVGDLTAPQIILDAGGAFKGAIDMGDVDTTRPSSEAKTASSARKSDSRKMQIPSTAQTLLAQEKNNNQKEKTRRPPTVAGKKRRVLRRK